MLAVYLQVSGTLASCDGFRAFKHQSSDCSDNFRPDNVYMDEYFAPRKESCFKNSGKYYQKLTCDEQALWLDQYLDSECTTSTGDEFMFEWGKCHKGMHFSADIANS